MHFLTISILLFSNVFIQLCTSVETSQQFYTGQKNNNNDACVCFPEGPALTPSILNHQSPERLVVYLYRNPVTREIDSFVPSPAKQALIPNIPATVGDKIRRVTIDLVASLFDKQSNVSPVNITGSPIGLNKGTIQTINSKLDDDPSNQKPRPNENVPSVDLPWDYSVELQGQQVPQSLYPQLYLQTGYPTYIFNIEPNQSPKINSHADIQYTIVSSADAPVRSETGTSTRDANPKPEVIQPITVLDTVQIAPPSVKPELYTPQSTNKYLTFDQWFSKQMKSFQNANSPDPIKAIDSDILRSLVQNTLIENQLHISSTGLITDADGIPVNVQNLELRPILIGNSFNYEYLQGNQQITLPQPLPYLEGILITLVYPPKILGIIPIGKTYVSKPSPVIPKVTNIDTPALVNRYYTGSSTSPAKPPELSGTASPHIKHWSFAAPIKKSFNIPALNSLGLSGSLSSNLNLPFLPNLSASVSSDLFSKRMLSLPVSSTSFRRSNEPSVGEKLKDEAEKLIQEAKKLEKEASELKKEAIKLEKEAKKLENESEKQEKDAKKLKKEAINLKEPKKGENNDCTINCSEPKDKPPPGPKPPLGPKSPAEPSGPKPAAQPESPTGPKSPAEPKALTKPKTESGPHPPPGPKPASGPQPPPGPKPASGPHSPPKQKPESGPHPPPSPKPESGPQPSPGPKPNSKSHPPPDPKTESGHHPPAGPKPESEPQSLLGPKPGSDSHPHLGPKPESRPHPISDPNQESGPHPPSDHKPDSKPPSESDKSYRRLGSQDLPPYNLDWDRYLNNKKPVPSQNQWNKSSPDPDEPKADSNPTKPFLEQKPKFNNKNWADNKTGNKNKYSSKQGSSHSHLTLIPVIDKWKSHSKIESNPLDSKRDQDTGNPHVILSPKAINWNILKSLPDNWNHALKSKKPSKWGDSHNDIKNKYPSTQDSSFPHGTASLINNDWNIDPDNWNSALETYKKSLKWGDNQNDSKNKYPSTQDSLINDDWIIDPNGWYNVLETYTESTNREAGRDKALKSNEPRKLYPKPRSTTPRPSPLTPPLINNDWTLDPNDRKKVLNTIAVSPNWETAWKKALNSKKPLKLYHKPRPTTRRSSILTPPPYPRPEVPRKKSNSPKSNSPDVNPRSGLGNPHWHPSTSSRSNTRRPKSPFYNPRRTYDQVSAEIGAEESIENFQNENSEMAEYEAEEKIPSRRFNSPVVQSVLKSLFQMVLKNLIPEVSGGGGKRRMGDEPIDINATANNPIEIEGAEDDHPDFRIIGGSAATGSGSPLSNKGRSGLNLSIN